MSKPPVWTSAMSRAVMRQWMDATTPEQHKALAKAAGTSMAYLSHLKHGHRAIRPLMAMRLEHAAATIKGAPPLPQSGLCRACHICPIRKR